MFIEFEGSWNEVFDEVKRATEAVAPFGSRVSLVINVDIRLGFESELDAKLERLENAIDESGQRPEMPLATQRDELLGSALFLQRHIDCSGSSLTPARYPGFRSLAPGKLSVLDRRLNGSAVGQS